MEVWQAKFPEGEPSEKEVAAERCLFFFFT
jgi:hypothetical protein